MAELRYDEAGRLLFTEEMKKEYTILIPQMLPVFLVRFISGLQAFRYHSAAFCRFWPMKISS